MTNVGITRVKNKKNTIHYKAAGTYYITTSAEMDEQYLSIQYKSDERTTNDYKLSNSCTLLVKIMTDGKCILLKVTQDACNK